MPKMYSRTYLMADVLEEERKRRISKIVLPQFTKMAKASGVELVGEPVVDIQPDLFTRYLHVTVKQFTK